MLINCSFFCVFRNSTYVFISVCYTGSVGEPQHGENKPRAPAHIKFNFSTGSVLLFTVISDTDILIRCLPFCSSPQTHGSSSNINHHNQELPHSSSSQGRRGRRRRHHRHQTPPSDQPQNTVQQILHPGNLLRRLLPSSSLFNSGSHTS